MLAVRLTLTAVAIMAMFAVSAHAAGDPAFTKWLEATWPDAQKLGVSRRTIYNRIRDGRLQTIRTLGGSQRVLLDSVQDDRSILLFTGMGGGVPLCSVGEYAGFWVSIDAACNTVTLNVILDACTGGNMFHDGGTLRRRVAR